jgi:putative endonuclease
MTYYVYILASQFNGTLYIGLTNYLERRALQHKMGETKGFTSKYGIKNLVYYEEYDNSEEAFLRERILKKWKRQWKINLFKESNPLWKDLAADWY